MDEKQLDRANCDMDEAAIPISKHLSWIVFGVIVVFVSYGGLLIFITWPVDSLSIDKVGTFGDSFGVLTSLFTGLAFTGLLSTIYLQREDLRLNRRELKETRREFQLQSDTFHRQRFEDAFYRLLSLYKENLRELSIRPHDTDATRIHGIEALNHLITKFDKAWAKHKLSTFPKDEAERIEYLYILASTIQSVFVRQTRYVETLSNILILVEEECVPIESKPNYWRIIASQLTAYELKYLFYQALVAPDFHPLRNMILQSFVLQDRLSMLSIPDPHRRAFEVIWGIALPKKRNPFRSPLSPAQVKQARKSIQKREKEAAARAVIQECSDDNEPSGQ